MEIKIAGVDDVDTIKKLAETIWPICYATIISKDQLHYMLQLIYSKESLMAQIKNGHQFILAIENEVAIGFASFSPKNEKETSIFRLHKIYVLPNTTIKGIGSFLLTHICNTSKSLGAAMLELNVNKYNTAIDFYKKKGFTITKEEVIDIGQGYVMDDYVMTLPL